KYPAGYGKNVRFMTASGADYTRAELNDLEFFRKIDGLRSIASNIGGAIGAAIAYTYSNDINEVIRRARMGAAFFNMVGAVLRLPTSAPNASPHTGIGTNRPTNSFGRRESNALFRAGERMQVFTTAKSGRGPSTKAVIVQKVLSKANMKKAQNTLDWLESVHGPSH
ncbi:MAG: hypothetical protein AAF941_05985, partial [Pseudomonadota bacterium]